MSITQSVCVFVALSIQYAMCMRPIVICPCPTLYYFSTLSHQRHCFRKKKIIEHESVCFFIFAPCILDM